jgi:hypothetical protein
LLFKDFQHPEVGEGACGSAPEDERQVHLLR